MKQEILDKFVVNFLDKTPEDQITPEGLVESLTEVLNFDSSTVAALQTNTIPVLNRLTGEYQPEIQDFLEENSTKFMILHLLEDEEDEGGEGEFPIGLGVLTPGVYYVVSSTKVIDEEGNTQTFYGFVSFSGEQDEITIDSQLNQLSNNPVSNSAIAQKTNEIEQSVSNVQSQASQNSSNISNNSSNIQSLDARVTILEEDEGGGESLIPAFAIVKDEPTLIPGQVGSNNHFQSLSEALVALKNEGYANGLGAIVSIESSGNFTIDNTVVGDYRGIIIKSSFGGNITVTSDASFYNFNIDLAGFNWNVFADNQDIVWRGSIDFKVQNINYSAPETPVAIIAQGTNNADFINRGAGVLKMFGVNEVNITVTGNITANLSEVPDISLGTLILFNPNNGGDFNVNVGGNIVVTFPTYDFGGEIIVFGNITRDINVSIGAVFGSDNQTDTTLTVFQRRISVGEGKIRIGSVGANNNRTIIYNHTGLNNVDEIEFTGGTISNAYLLNPSSRINGGLKKVTGTLSLDVTNGTLAPFFDNTFSPASTLSSNRPTLLFEDFNVNFRVTSTVNNKTPFIFRGYDNSMSVVFKNCTFVGTPGQVFSIETTDGIITTSTAPAVIFEGNNVFDIGGRSQFLVELNDTYEAQNSKLIENKGTVRHTAVNSDYADANRQMTSTTQFKIVE